MTDQAMNQPTPPPLEVSLDDFTLGELEELETISGVPAGQLVNLSGSGAELTAGLTVAIVYLIRRRQDPAVTLDSVRSLKMAELFALLGGEPDPGEPAPNPDAPVGAPI